MHPMRALLVPANVIALLFVTPLSAQVPAVPPPPEQSTADCRNPTFATDQLVCTNPDLRALDTQLAELLVGATEPVSKWFEPQGQWLLRRSRCAFSEAHAECARAAYRERIALLRPLEPGARMLPARCDASEIKSVAVSPERIVLLDKSGRVLGVAQNADARGNWQAFLVILRRDRKIFMRSVSGDSLKCRTGKRRAEQG
jgi:uncharacterized protein